MLVLFMSALNEAHATSENEKKSKKGPGSEKKATATLEVKEISKDDVTTIANPEFEIASDNITPAQPTYFQQSYSDQEITSSGEDQNAVLSFNVIQYIFQRFKFSEEVY